MLWNKRNEDERINVTRERGGVNDVREGKTGMG